MYVCMYVMYMYTLLVIELLVVIKSANEYFQSNNAKIMTFHPDFWRQPIQKDIEKNRTI